MLRLLTGIYCRGRRNEETKSADDRVGKGEARWTGKADLSALLLPAMFKLLLVRGPHHRAVALSPAVEVAAPTEE
jgi:hypothetical protein